MKHGYENPTGGLCRIRTADAGDTSLGAQEDAQEADHEEALWWACTHCRRAYNLYSLEKEIESLKAAQEDDG